MVFPKVFIYGLETSIGFQNNVVILHKQLGNVGKPVNQK